MSITQKVIKPKLGLLANANKPSCLVPQSSG